MRDFVFVLKNDSTKKATLRVDIIEDEFKKFTIMWWEGVSGTIFEKYMPWKLGDVITEDEINDWLFKFQPVINGYKYGSDVVETLGAEEFELTITPTITNGDLASVIVSCTNEFDIGFKETVSLTDGSTSKIKIIKGYEYSFELAEEGDVWTTTKPANITCDGDEAVAVAINIPIVLTQHKLTITPTITDATTGSVTVRGTKAGFATLDTIVVLETTVPVDTNIYESYTYAFILPAGSSWTVEAPANITCDGDEVVDLAITVV